MAFSFKQFKKHAWHSNNGNNANTSYDIMNSVVVNDIHHASINLVSHAWIDVSL